MSDFNIFNRTPTIAPFSDEGLKGTMWIEPTMENEGSLKW